MYQDTYRIIFSVVKYYNCLPREKKEVLLAYNTSNTFLGFMLSCQIVYLFFFNNQHVPIKVEGFTPSTSLHHHET